jgi:hypothetical protein
MLRSGKVVQVIDKKPKQKVLIVNPDGVVAKRKRGRPPKRLLSEMSQPTENAVAIGQVQPESPRLNLQRD